MESRRCRKRSHWKARGFTRLPTVRQLALELDTGFGSVQRAVCEMTEVGILISRRRTGIYVSPLATETAVRRVLDGELNGWARRRVCEVEREKQERIADERGEAGEKG